MTKPLTPEQVAEHFGMTVEAVLRLVKAGELVAINVSAGSKKARYRISVRAVRDFERRRSTQPARKPKRRTRRRGLEIESII